MSYPAVPPSPEDPTAGLGNNRDGYTRSFEPPPAVDPYSPPVSPPPLPPPVSSPPLPPPVSAYQPPPPAYPPQPPAYQPPPAYPAQPPAYQPAAYQPPAYQPQAYQFPGYQAPVPPYQAAAGYPPQYQPIGLPAPAPTSNWSAASLVLGIVGILFGWCALGIPSLLAIVFGHLGLNETRTGAKTGRGMAIAGLILGYVCLIPTLLITIWIIGSDAATTSP